MSTPQNTAYDIRLADSSDPSVEILGAYAFSDTPSKPPTEEQTALRRRLRQDDKTFVSCVDDQPIAKVAIVPMTMNVRGAVMPMGGISGVASMPAGRRSGHVRELMNHSIKVMREDGQPVSALYPFRESFYERFGYTGWPAARWVEVDPANLGAILRVPKTGTVRQRELTDAFDDWTAFVDERQASIHGFSIYGPARREEWREPGQYWATTVHEGDRITGAMIYKITNGLSLMLVMSMLWSTVDAQYQLIDFIARHVDHIRKARICVPPGDQPELWLTDAKMTVLSDVPESWNGPMARIVSLDGIGGIAVGTGEIAIQVTDPQAPWNQGVWTLRSVDGTLHVEKGGDPQVKLSIQALSALVFTGIDPALLRFRGWGDPDAATMETLRNLFPPVEPFIFEMF